MEFLGTLQNPFTFAFVVSSMLASDQPDVLVILAGAGLIGMALVMPLAADMTSSTREHAAGI